MRCLIVHPGPPGDRRPAALDWAILEGVAEWGVTVLQADGEFTAGPIWVHRTFPMRRAANSSIYRNEVTPYAVEAVLEAIAAIEAGHEAPAPMASDDPRIRVRGPAGKRIARSTGSTTQPSRCFARSTAPTACPA